MCRYCSYQRVPPLAALGARVHLLVPARAVPGPDHARRRLPLGHAHLQQRALQLRGCWGGGGGYQDEGLAQQVRPHAAHHLHPLVRDHHRLAALLHDLQPHRAVDT